jgi:hypothetical protein
LCRFHYIGRAVGSAVSIKVRYWRAAWAASCAFPVRSRACAGCAKPQGNRNNRVRRPAGRMFRPLSRYGQTRPCGIRRFYWWTMCSPPARQRARRHALCVHSNLDKSTSPCWHTARERGRVGSHQDSEASREVIRASLGIPRNQQARAGGKEANGAVLAGAAKSSAWVGPGTLRVGELARFSDLPFLARPSYWIAVKGTGRQLT